MSVSAPNPACDCDGECERFGGCFYPAPTERQPLRMTISDLADSLLDGITVELAKFDTETLLAIAEYRDSVYREGWMQRAIRDYVEAWR